MSLTLEQQGWKFEEAVLLHGEDCIGRHESQWRATAIHAIGDVTFGVGQTKEEAEANVRINANVHEPGGMTTLDSIADAVHLNAWRKGWHDHNENLDGFLERACNNLHDEISELHEAWRNNQLYSPCDKADKMREAGIEPLTCIEEEMADIVIRLLDNARKFGVNIQSAIERKHAFNKTRPDRHGGKKS